jgi:hypothetical protein
MTRTIVGIVAAVLLIVAAWLGYERWQDHVRAERTAAEVKIEEHAGAAAALGDSVRTGAPGVAGADSTLTGILERPARPPRPRVDTLWLRDTVPGAPDSAAYVPAAALEASQAAYDALAVAARAYRDSTRAQLLRYPRLVAELDSVVRYQRVLIEHPAPRRNWGLGISCGEGVVYVDHRVTTGPSCHVGLSYSL